MKFTRTGSCSFGDRCKYLHGGNTDQKQSPLDKVTRTSAKCTFCNNKGHTIDVCRKKAQQDRRGRSGPAPSVNLAAVTAEPPPSAANESFAFAFSTDLTCASIPGDVDVSSPDTSEEISPEDSAFAFPLQSNHASPAGWILDSGATACATFAADDCTDIKPCNITVTSAGCTFVVTQVGTAVIHTLDTGGKPRVITIKGCLISDRFPYRLLAIQVFTNKGHSVSMVGPRPP